MSDPIKQRIGAHDTGFWDASNPINADKKPIASGLSVDAAIAKAKEHDGAELIVVDSEGKASVHSLSVEDSFWDENKKVLLSELDRDPALKVNSAKTPLAIDNNIAIAFSSQAAFLVDEKNKSTYLGDDVDQTTAAVKLVDSDKFLNQPTQSKVDAAYAIARDAGDERHVDRSLGNQVLNHLQRDYRQTDSAQHDIAFLKDGAVKTQIESLTGELNTLAGQESERVTDLRTELADRTAKYQKDLPQPTAARDKALTAWTTANQQETQKVDAAAHQLREARMPGVYQLEQDLNKSQENSQQLGQTLKTAVTYRSSAESRLRELEQLPVSAENHLRQAGQLEANNRNLYIQVQTYTVVTLNSVRSEIRQTERDLSQTRYALQEERNKPERPTSGGSNDPYGKDPFAEGGNNVGTNDPYGKDPFAGGGNGSGSNYRDSQRINSLASRASLLSSEYDDLSSRERSLEVVNSRLAFTQDIDQISLLFYDLDSIDRLALNQYKQRKDQNETGIRNHKRTAANEQNQYRQEIGGARRNLAERVSTEETARARFGQAESQVANVDDQLTHLKENPRPDSHAGVKPFAVAHQQAVVHKEASVGPKAALTAKRDATQSVVDTINGDYRGDKQSLDNQIANVQQSLGSEARGKIDQTRSQISR